MIKTQTNSNTKKGLAIILVLAMVISGAILAVNGTLAAPNDITVNLTKPAGAPATDIEVGSTYTIPMGGIYSAAGSNNNIAIITPPAVMGEQAKIKGVNAGVVSVAVSTAGYSLILNYQITDSNNISAYTLQNNGQVMFSGAGVKKTAPVTTTPASAINTIEWSSLQPAVATVDSTGAITSVSKGAAIINGVFTDKWGVKQIIQILVGVGINLDGSSLDDLINLINQGETILGLSPNPYTPESLAALQTAVDNGKNVLNSANPDDASVQRAIDGLTNALNSLEKALPADVVKGDDGNYYRPVGVPPHVWEKVDNNGRPLSQPSEYVYNPGDKPGNANDRPAYPDNNGGYWVEDPTGSNIYKQVDGSGNLIDSPAVWGGNDGVFGTGDDKPVQKFGNDYWVDMGQNVWRKVNKTAPTTLGPLTGGGPSENPAVEDVRPIVENNGSYYIGPLGPDSDNNYYYYGDSRTNGDSKVNSTNTVKNSTDDKFYLSNGQMVTENPKDITSVNVNPNYVTVAKSKTQTFNAQVLRRDGTPDGDVTWTVSPADAGTSITSTNGTTGVLTVGAGETNATLTVTATSVTDPSIKGTATVTVSDNPDAIKYIDIKPASAVVEKGNTQVFTADAYKNNNALDNAGVTWTVSPAGSGTSIDQNGILTIGIGETNTTLIVTATSKTDANVKSTAIVTVIPKALTPEQTAINNASINSTVNIDGYDWYVVRKVTAGGANYAMLVAKNPMRQDVSFSVGTANSNYDGSNVQSVVTQIYTGLNVLKTIAVVPDLGTLSSLTSTTEPTAAMAGSQTKNIMFALSYRDVYNWNGGKETPLISPLTNYKMRWLTRSPSTSVTVYEIMPTNLSAPGYLTGGLNALGYNGETVVPGIWVKIS